MRTAHAGQTRVSLPALRTARAQMAAAGSLASAAAAHRVSGSSDAACCRESKAPCKRGRQGRKCRPWPASAWLFGAIAGDDEAAAVGAVAGSFGMAAFDAGEEAANGHSQPRQPCALAPPRGALSLVRVRTVAHSLSNSPLNAATSPVSRSHLVCSAALSFRSAFNS